jgi:hypothetical protein
VYWAEKLGFQRQGGRHNKGDRSNLPCTHCKKNGSHEADDCTVPWDNIKEDRRNKKEGKGKTSEPAKGNPFESAHYVVSHCNIGVTEDLFNTSYTLWKDAWLLDTGATSDMTFQRDFFEDFNDNVDSVFCR